MQPTRYMYLELSLAATSLAAAAKACSVLGFLESTHT